MRLIQSQGFRYFDRIFVMKVILKYFSTLYESYFSNYVILKIADVANY